MMRTAESFSNTRARERDPAALRWSAAHVSRRCAAIQTALRQGKRARQRSPHARKISGLRVRHAGNGNVAPKCKRKIASLMS